MAYPGGPEGLNKASLEVERKQAAWEVETKVIQVPNPPLPNSTEPQRGKEKTGKC
jgi:hypothetical protein